MYFVVSLSVDVKNSQKKGRSNAFSSHALAEEGVKSFAATRLFPVVFFSRSIKLT